MSLYGGDAEADYDAIVRLVGGRRVNLSEPARSLIVLKPTEFVERGGGTVLSQESEALKLLLDWVRQGAPLATTRHLTRVEILPKRHVARSLGDPAPAAPPAAGAGPVVAADILPCVCRRSLATLDCPPYRQQCHPRGAAGPGEVIFHLRFGNDPPA